MTKVKKISKMRVLVIGDRIVTDIKGAQDFGVDACWYNPKVNYFFMNYFFSYS